jgi:predicted RNase H-like HicB family nuclease
MRVWRDGSWYVGQLRELPAVISQGKTLPELRANVRDAYRLLLKGLRHRKRAASA